MNVSYLVAGGRGRGEREIGHHKHANTKCWRKYERSWRGRVRVSLFAGRNVGVGHSLSFVARAKTLHDLLALRIGKIFV